MFKSKFTSQIPILGALLFIVQAFLLLVTQLIMFFVEKIRSWQ